MGVPVLAYAATAVPVDDGRRRRALYRQGSDARRRPDQRGRRRSGAVAATIVDGQYAALDRLEAKDFAGTLLRHIDSVLATPRREHPPVAFDFWDQVDQAEDYDEIKQYRPSAFTPSSGAVDRREPTDSRQTGRQ